MAESSPETLGRYTIRSEIGRGGFATVYQALDTSLNRDVALKVLHPQLLADRSFVERFRREARTLAALRHAHIITIYEVSEAEGRLFIAMELAHGSSLAQAIADRQLIPWADALSILKQVSEALEYAHGQGVVHRDLKPANILLDAERGPLLTDFGFARLLSDSSASMSLSGGILGTPAYIAPEVWELDTATAKADIYALGCIAYEMLTGTVLFMGKTPMQVMRAHDRGPQFPAAWPGEVPGQVDSVLQVALARKPENRYPTATTFWHALNDLEADAKVARERVERQAIANQWKEEVETALAAHEWSAAKMAVGRWLSITPDDPQALAARTEIERQMQVAAGAAQRAEEERARQAVAQQAKETAEGKAREKERVEQEQRHQAELMAQAAAAEKAKREAELAERKKWLDQTAVEDAQRKQTEQQRQAAPKSQNVAQGSIERVTAVIDRKRFWRLSVIGGALGWGLGWWISLGSIYSYYGLPSIIIFILLGSIAGLIIGFAQWRVLRSILAGSWKWIVASILGLSAGCGLGVFVLSTSSIYPSDTQFAIFGGIAGLGLGFAQWLVVRRQMYRVVWWFVANVGALALGFSIAFGSIGPSSRNLESFGAVIILTLGCMLHSVITGWLLPLCLKPLAQ